jgi:DNA-binding transcriptional ArsR family regulator
MSNRKFSDVQLEQLVIQGNGVSQIARILGVSKGTVSKRLKSLNVGITKNVTLHNAGEIVKKEINAAEQLLKINRTANELLDMLMACINGDEKTRRAAMEKVAPLLGAKSGPLEAAVKIKAEIRQQLKLQLDIFTALYDMEAVAQFQREVLEAIGDADLETRDRIIRNLKERNAIRSTLEFH